MTMSETRRARLAALLQQEKSKDNTLTLKQQARKPSQFRDTSLHTHDTLPAYDFLDKGAAVRAEKQATRVATAGRRAGRPSRSPAMDMNTPPGVPQALASARPHYSRLQNMEHNARTQSEWALLDTLQVEMANSEFVARKDAEHHRRQQQRAYLDKQMMVVEEQKIAEQQRREQERAQVLAAVEKNYADEQARAAYNRARNQKIAQEATEARAAAVAKRERMQRMRMALEQEELEQTERALAEAERAKLVAKQKHTEQMLQTLKENEAKIAAKVAAKQQEAAEDRKLMAQTLETLEAQDLERERKLAQFHADIAARSGKAGEMVVADRAEREERERQMLMRHQKQMQAKEEADRIARVQAKEVQKREVERARSAQKRHKDHLRAMEEQEMLAYVAAVKAEDEAQMADEVEKAARVRKANLDVAAAQRAQIAHKQDNDALDGIFMDDRERDLNAAALNQAEAHVKYPHVLPLRF